VNILPFSRNALKILKKISLRFLNLLNNRSLSRKKIKREKLPMKNKVKFRFLNLKNNLILSEYLYFLEKKV
jgi:hypothetical protein